MTEEKEAFLGRWSRLKREQVAREEAPAPAVPAAKEEAPAQPLPPVEDLKPESDFTPFMNPKVDPQTRRLALKKLFADAHFNVPDPFEAYSEDYTKSDPIPAQMLKAINRVRDVALRGEEKVLEEERLAEAEQAPEPKASVEGPKASVEGPKASVEARLESAVPTEEAKHVAGRQDA